MIWADQVKNLHAASLIEVVQGPNAQFLRGFKPHPNTRPGVSGAFKANVRVYTFYRVRRTKVGAWMRLGGCWLKSAASGPRTDLGVMVGYYRHDDAAHPRQLTHIDSPLSSLCGQQPALSAFGYDGAGRMVQQAGKALQFDGFDQHLKVDEPSVPSLEYSYGFEGFRTWRKGPGQEEFWFSAGDVMRSGIREHVITVGDRLVARVKAPKVGGGAMGPVRWNWDTREERKVGRMPLPEFAMLVLMAGLCAALAVMSAVQARRRRHWAPAGAAGMVAVLLGAMVAGGCGNALTRTGQAWTTPEVTYVHHGVAAGPVLFTRPNGSVLDERRYEPFGGDIDSYRENVSREGQGQPGIDYSIDPQNLLNKETDSAPGSLAEENVMT
jgi:hypothetical protein